MKVLQQSVDKLNAILKVEIKSEDYQNKVKTSLEKYRKSAKVPGFRPGKVPFGMIEKQYGKSVLAEELNKLANDSLYKYITEEKLEILGNPIPTEDEKFKMEWDKWKQAGLEPQQTLSVDVDELAQVDLEYNNHRDNICSGLIPYVFYIH